MIISADVRIPYSRSLVYATYRDKIVELLPYLPDVRQVEVKSRREEDGRVYCVNEWHGGGEIPVLAKALLSEELLSWTEYDTWEKSEFAVEWHIETHAFTEAVYCAGKNHFLEDGDATVIENRGELTINPKQLKEVPPFLRGQVARAVEDFLGNRIEPNLRQMSDGVRRYLEQKAVD